MPGHLFIVRSDLTQITCDAWLLPTDAWLTIEEPWLAALPADLRAVDALRHAAPHFGHTEHVSVLPAGEPLRLADAASGATRAPAVPRVVLANVGGVPREDMSDRILEFLEASLQCILSSSIPGRQQPLFAFPLIGTGRGGWTQDAGAVTEDIVRAALGWVAGHDADAVLVARDAQAFSAAQSARRRLTDWPGLPDDLATAAGALGRQAAFGRLVLFLGAGIGYPAGLPLWGDLLDDLAEEAGVDANEVDALKSLDPRDAARIIESRLGKPGRLGEAIARRMDVERFGLTTALLANLPVVETVTTNYDTLFEAAAGAAGRKLAVLPYQTPEGEAWLLKLHGTVDSEHRDDIVLTRGDYLRYADRRAALAGIVQALLITRRMLFVGFSLTDENFHRIADDVRKAVGAGEGRAGRQFGTAVLLDEQPMLEQLWDDELAFVKIATDIATGGRELDVFLDHVLAAASTGASHLLDPRFDGVLDEGERQLSSALKAFKDDLPDAARRTPAWAVVEEMLDQLTGGSNLDRRGVGQIPGRCDD